MFYFFIHFDTLFNLLYISNCEYYTRSRINNTPLWYRLCGFFWGLVPIYFLNINPFLSVSGLLNFMIKYIPLFKPLGSFIIRSVWEIFRVILVMSHLTVNPVNYSSCPMAPVKCYLLVYSNVSIGSGYPLTTSMMFM